MEWAVAGNGSYATSRPTDMSTGYSQFWSGIGEMELAGLEPATSWVRCIRSRAWVPRKSPALRALSRE
jgi:hypothetical protein